jgi:hypothetical protein
MIYLLFSNTIALEGIDFSSLAADFSCFRSNGKSFGIVRGYRSLGIVDSNLHTNIARAKQAGFHLEIYMFPCRGKRSYLQVSELVSALSAAGYRGRVWVDLEVNPKSECSWAAHSAQANC